MSGRVLNAFERVAQKARTPASAAPAAAPARPLQRGRGQAIVLPGSGRTGAPRALDITGRPTVALEPRRFGPPITSRAQSQADADRRAAIARGSIGPRTPRTPPTPPAPALPPAPTPVQIVQSGVQNGDSPAGATYPRAALPDAPQAVLSDRAAPQDLAAWLGGQPVAQIARRLGVSRGQAHRLKTGYWPADSRALLAAWDAYKGRTTAQQSGWFLRRVHDGGRVYHAGSMWSAPGLALRAGQTLAVARSAGDGLLAQTLELPSERFALAALPGAEEAAA